LYFKILVPSVEIKYRSNICHDKLNCFDESVRCGRLDRIREISTLIYSTLASHVSDIL
jgi:hypothetical protein